MTPTTSGRSDFEPPAPDTSHGRPGAQPVDRSPTANPEPPEAAAVSRPQPGEQPPAPRSGGPGRPRLERPPGDRYAAPDASRSAEVIVWPPLAVAVGGVVAYTVLGGLLSITAGLIVVAAFVGWLLGKLIVGPPRAAVVALATVGLGLLGVWLFGRLEGGDLDPVAYLDAVQGWPLVALQLLAGGGLAAASSR